MRILIFKVNQLGDNLLYLPVVQELQRRFGRESIDLWTTPTASGLYGGLVAEDRLHLFGRDEFNKAWKSPLRFARLLRLVRRHSPDMVLVPFDQGNVARLLTRFSGARHRIGVESPGLRTNWCLGSCLPMDLRAPMAGEDWKIMEAVASVTGRAFPSSPPPPDLSHLLPSGHEVDPRTVLIHPGASREYKKWPMERFVALAGTLLDAGFKVLWSSQGEGAEDELDPRAEVLPLGRLEGFIVRLAGCGLFIGNNSGPMNIANALGVPSLIFSGPSPPMWDPFWHRERTINLRLPELACQPCDEDIGPVEVCQNREEPMACMMRWSVAAVAKEVEALWGRMHGAGAQTSDTE